MENKLEAVKTRNLVRGQGQTMDSLSAIKIISPKAIWVSLMPNRAERRATARRRVRNCSHITAQTPNYFLNQAI